MWSAACLGVVCVCMRIWCLGCCIGFACIWLAFLVCFGLSGSVCGVDCGFVYAGNGSWLRVSLFVVTAVYFWFGSGLCYFGDLWAGSCALLVIPFLVLISSVDCLF